MAEKTEHEASQSPSPQQAYTWRYIYRVALEHRSNLIKANVMAILAVLAAVPIPLLMPLLVDEVLLNKPGPLVHALDRIFPAGWHGPVLYIVAMLLATVLLRLAALALNVWQTRQFTLISKDITFRMRRDLLHWLPRVSMAEYETLGSGTVASHLVTDINAIDEFVGQSISRTLIAALTLVGVSVVLLWMHWKLALFILLLNPVVIYFTVVFGKRVKQLKKRENSAFALFQQSVAETLDAIQELRAYNRDKLFLQRVVDRARDIKTHSAAFSWKSDAASRLSFGIFLVGFDAFRAVSMLMVVFSGLTVGKMMAVFGYLWFMMAPVQDLLNIQYAWFAAKAALARVNKLLSLRQEPHYAHLKNPFRDHDTVSVDLDDIHFSYGDKPVLKGVTIHVDPGEKIALVGASGGGKSTLVQVLLGMYEPQRGHIVYGGADMREIGLDCVRENVAVVFQHPAMFNDTIRMNLTLGAQHQDDELWRALEIAQLKSVVAAMDDGLDTVIGRSGMRLSGGQQQRLAIARMVLTDPKVVLLDEATSALDTETEANLHRALSAYLENRTTLIIAHRLSSVRQADRVYVFENGQIIEEGVHDELIRSDGLYRKLYGEVC
ncbi:MAG: ABC transporter ATP-binding protein [Gammaproteobacteria bacterium]|nr:MAG: ABC transporter ATP-binding protein [Gammaproteobacteria bacterium]